MRRKACACLLTVTSLLLPAAAASAKDWAISFPTGLAPSQYSPSTYTIQQGDTVTWTGAFANHPLVSGNGAWTTVMTGSSFTFQFNTAGSYAFNCQNHPTVMFGTITVQAPPPPGGGGGSPPPGPGQPPPPGSQPPPPQAKDSVAPTVALATIGTRSAARSGVAVRFRSSEAGSSQATLKAKGKTLGAARATYSTAGVHTLRVKLTKAAKSLLKRARKLRASLTLVVRDAAGNTAPRLSRTVTIRR